MDAILILAVVSIGTLPTVAAIVFWMLYRRERRARLRCEARARAREATFAGALGESKRQTTRVEQIEREVAALRTEATTLRTVVNLISTALDPTRRP